MHGDFNQSDLRKIQPPLFLGQIKSTLNVCNGLKPILSFIARIPALIFADFNSSKEGLKRQIHSFQNRLKHQAMDFFILRKFLFKQWKFVGLLKIGDRFPLRAIAVIPMLKRNVVQVPAVGEGCTQYCQLLPIGIDSIFKVSNHNTSIRN